MKCSVCGKDATCLLYINWKGSKRYFGRCNEHIIDNSFIQDKEMIEEAKQLLKESKDVRADLRKLFNIS